MNNEKLYDRKLYGKPIPDEESRLVRSRLPEREPDLNYLRNVLPPNYGRSPTNQRDSLPPASQLLRSLRMKCDEGGLGDTVLELARGMSIVSPCHKKIDPVTRASDEARYAASVEDER